MYSKIKQFLNMVPKDLTSANEIYNFARNAYKQIMGVFPDGLDNVFLKRGAAEMQDVRQKVVKFPEGGKDKTDFFSTRPDPRLKQPKGAKMDVQRAHENISGGSGYAEGDTKYNADILGTELARVRGFIDEGQDATDMDPKAYSKLYDEAYSYLTELRFLNKPPKKEGVKSINLAKELEELTNKNLKERGLGEIKLGDKLPPPKNKKPDVDPKLKEFEDNKDKPGVTMWCQDMSDLPFEDREIDFVRASDVLQCSVMPYITLLEFNRVLKKGGQVFIEVPLPHQPLKHEYIRNRYSVLGQAQLEALLFRSGFDVEWAKITTVPVKNNESNEEFNDQSLTILATLKRPIDIK